ncbi:hypothetical protein [Actinoplanes sp. HUAS TT8]|uniref:hypothetical protein n=1 Tax=Actinoplanes sp. HUAS TT8 TaxID=3447453 RepID=UPI003F51BCB8
MSGHSRTEQQDEADPPEHPEVVAANIVARATKQIQVIAALATVLAACIAASSSVMTTRMVIAAARPSPAAARTDPAEHLDAAGPGSALPRGCVIDGSSRSRPTPTAVPTDE